MSGSRETHENTVSIIKLSFSWRWSSADGRKWLDPACTLMLKGTVILDGLNVSCVRKMFMVGPRNWKVGNVIK